MKEIISKLFQKAGLLKGYEGKLPGEIYESYYASRTIGRKKYLCHAPFNNMYFNSVGDIANCWLTFDDPEKYSEDRTIKEIWMGEKFSGLRNNIKNFDLTKRCKTCQYYLEHHNHVNILARAYDNEYPITDFPSMMEFELDSTCNLECTMCNGLLSSSIRKNREGLPPLRSPYGDKFVKELREFIPHLKEARFNGGEPFLIPIYYKIWDAVLALNPSLRMVIATNGSVLNARVKDYLSRGNFHINLSMDGFSKETYEKVRINGDHDRLMQNFQYFRQYCKDNDRVLCIMINPMRQNWQEMPDFVNFCNEQNIQLWFNTIVRPEDQAIWNLTAGELKNIYSTLSNAKINPRSSASSDIYKYNLSTYDNLVQHQIKDWLSDAVRREQQKITSPVDSAISAQDRFWDKMNAHILLTDPADADKKRTLLAARIEALRLSLADDWDDEKAYSAMLSPDINIVYTTLSSAGIEGLTTMMKDALLIPRA